MMKEYICKNGEHQAGCPCKLKGAKGDLQIKKKMSHKDFSDIYAFSSKQSYPLSMSNKLGAIDILQKAIQDLIECTEEDERSSVIQNLIEELEENGSYKECPLCYAELKEGQEHIHTF